MDWLIPPLTAISFASLGFWLRRSYKYGQVFSQRLNYTLIHFIYPCLIFSSITENFTAQSLVSNRQLPSLVFAGMSAALCIAALIAWKLAKSMPSDKLKSLVFMITMPNFVFLPLLITQGFWSEKDTARLILASFGGDIFLWLFLIPILSGRLSLWKIFSKPPIFTLLISVAVVFNQSSLIQNLTTYIQSISKPIGQLTVASSMFLLGAFFSQQKWAQVEWPLQLKLAGWRLIVFPSLVASILLISETSYETARILLLIACMPTAFASAIVSPLIQSNAHFAAEQIFISHFLAIFTIPCWIYATGHLF